MTHAVWVAASLLFVLFGVAAPSLDRPARMAVRFATGIVIAGVVMYAESIAGIPWTRAGLLIPLSVVAVLLWAAQRNRQPATDNRQPLRSWFPIAAITLLAAYGAATARETCGDLLYFWGPKGHRFFFTQTIDVEFLKFPFYYLMHSDYPPLQPLVYAWNSIAAHRFSYWGAVWLTPLYLLAAVAAFRGLAAPKIGESKATACAVLLASLLAFGFMAGVVAGGADAQLILFEIIALSALTFRDDADLVAALALAGAVFTKVEGAAFAIAILGAHALVRRNWRRSLLLATPPAILLASWIVFARTHVFLDSYALGGAPLHLESLQRVLQVLGFEANYGAMYLPWIVTLAPLAFARRWGRATLPLLVAAGAIVYTIFFYLHEPDAVWWIKASAQRVLLTPLAALLVATAAASE